MTEAEWSESSDPVAMLPSPEEAEYGGGIYWCPGCGGTEPGPRAAGHEYPYWMCSPGPHYPGFWALDVVTGRT